MVLQQSLLTGGKCVASSPLSSESVPLVDSLTGDFLGVRLVRSLPRACTLGDVALFHFVARQEGVEVTAWAAAELLLCAWRFPAATVMSAQHGKVEALQALQALQALHWFLTENDTEPLVGKGIGGYVRKRPHACPGMIQRQPHRKDQLVGRWDLKRSDQLPPGDCSVSQEAHFVMLVLE